jgi:uncharacterized damage-inducible protein DinB
MKLKMLSFLAFCIIGIAAASAQASPPTSKQGDPAKAVQALVDRLDREFTNIAKAMPADKYDFTPTSLSIRGADFVKVRSFADQVKHVAQANYSIAANVASTGEPTAEIAAIGKLKNKDEILAALQASFARMHRAIATITPANANDVIDDIGVGPNQTRESEAVWCAVHGYDHYGQMVEYLRMNGIVPKP